MKNDRYKDYVAMSLKYLIMKRKKKVCLVICTSTIIKSKKMYIKLLEEKILRIIVLENVTLWMIYYSFSLLSPIFLSAITLL